mmetsp:Transcript_14516/g.18959  ORF Transcript_14516/g.18959 Transcript_14516/m.18959 type:complete len:468 (+) Transcript_14516:104-1507(+)
MALTVSAPGKLLLAGGYLVLESPNTGVVIGVDKRFYCTIDCRRTEETTSSSAVVAILVKSPQFNQEWTYHWDRATMSLTQIGEGTSENPFCEKTLRLSLLCLLSKDDNSNQNNDNISDIELIIKGDNDFYSLVPHLKELNLPLNLDGALQLPAFLPAAQDDNGKILKTGLGSSACLVTSLVAALVHALQTDRSSNDEETTLGVIFRLAQICHCHAQGKVGSGFDVASACFGSHIYQRFPKETIDDLLVQLDDSSLSPPIVQKELRTKVFDTDWEGGLQAPLLLPPFLQVMLADVSGGSESPSMARNVLSWKKTATSENGSVPHWDDLATLNPQVGLLWQDLNLHSAPTPQEVEALASARADEWNMDTPLGQTLHKLHKTLQETRAQLKEMGEKAKVPIEPNEQSSLADATLQIPGVVAALVPGAGGYDALACIYINTETVRNNIAKLWSQWSSSEHDGNNNISSVAP